MEQTLIIGVDVSKLTLDICMRPNGLTVCISNEAAGYKQWYRQLRSQCFVERKVLVVMEHTGYYSYRFEKFLRQKGIGYCKVPALEIKRSLGIARGKSDKIDAERIAEYAWLRRDILTADMEIDQEITKLNLLVSLRQKLVRDRSGYLCRSKDMKGTGIAELAKSIMKTNQEIINVFNKQIKAVEMQIRELISAHAELNKTCQLLCSIKGVGLIIAAYMISCTRNFTRFSNFRKFNCYAGLAPFKHESGKSIRSRSRVSHLANKKAKSLLNLAASCSIRHDQEMKQYYRKRVEEGKPKMSCLNIIRSKIVSRMFAVVKRQTPYQPLSIAA